jgi:predicted CXXCH cytochrome family protein
MQPQEIRALKLGPVPPEAHRRADGVDVWRFWVPVLAVLLLGTWRAADHLLGAAPGPAWHTPGPVAAVHAAWEADCAACHKPLTQLSAASWTGWFHGTTHAADGHCRTCHAGADHHAAENPDHRAGCTACHPEHRGREASLLRVPDKQCTRCHANLLGHLAEGARTVFRNVTRFDADRAHHPEFGVLVGKPLDPGKLKFNHRLHMTPGMGRTPESEPFTLAKVDPRYREFYRRPGDEGDDVPVRLDCVACHQRDSGDFPARPAQAGRATNPPPPPDRRDYAAVLAKVGGVPLNAALPARSPGAAMLPLVYEKHCQACHPLTFERADPNDPRSGPQAVQHRLQPVAVHTYLEAYYTAELLKGRGPVLDRPLLPRPGKGPDPEARKARDAIAEQVLRAEQELYLSKKSCGECHHWQPFDPALPPRLAGLRVAPTDVKAVWLEHAAFNHATHRLLSCRACHADAYARDEQEAVNPRASVDSRDVLLPGIDTCLECHRPARPAPARQDCVECHRYHDGDRPLGGRGSATRAGPNAGTRSVRQFLDRTPR